MERIKQKLVRRQRRQKRIRKTIFGTPERPRLTVSRSLKHIYVQLVDDTAGRTLVEASSLSKELRGGLKKGSDRAAAEQVGTLLAQRAGGCGIEQVVFDRNGYKFHGRVKALAEAARKSGLKF